MFEKIAEVVCDGQGVPFNEVTGDRRDGDIVYTRQLIAALSRFFKVGKDEYIADLMGKKRLLIVHSAKVIQNYIDTDPIKAAQIDAYKQKIAGNVIDLEQRLINLENRLTFLEMKNMREDSPKGQYISPMSGYRPHQR